MARKLETFPTFIRSTYPWDEWLDGSVWELTEGEDFTSKIPTIRMNAKVQAKKRAGNVRTRVLKGEDDDSPAKLVIQYFSENGAGS